MTSSSLKVLGLHCEPVALSSRAMRWLPVVAALEVVFVRHGHACHNALSYQGREARAAVQNDVHAC